MPIRRERFINNHFYHIIFRGFNQRILFLEDRDRLRFLLSALLINKTAPGTASNLARWDDSEMVNVLDGKKDVSVRLVSKESPLVKILTFSFLENHIHFLLKQLKSGGIQSFSQRLQNSYAKFSNTKYNNKGPVFEKNFRAVPITDDKHFRYVVGYITLNPLDTVGIKWRKVTLNKRWGRVKKILDSYPWSSYHYFIGRPGFRALIDGDLMKELFSTPKQFEEHLKEWRGDGFMDLV